MAQQAQHSGDDRALDFALTYNTQHGPTTGGNGFWLQGGAVDVAETFYRGLGVAANFAGETSSNIGAAGSTPVGLTMVTATFGPRYTWSPPIQSRLRNLRFFGQGSDRPGARHGQCLS